MPMMMAVSVVRERGTFKDRSAGVGRNAAGGRETALQKQLQVAVRDRQELIKHYDAKDQKCNELREKLKQAKASLAAKERELEVSQKLLQKLGAERTELREENASMKVHVRKVEAKLGDSQAIDNLMAKYRAVQHKATTAQQQLTTVSAELKAAQDLLGQQQKELATLNRAVEVRANVLGGEAGGQGVSVNLLYQLAESREESLELAKQLAATKTDVNRLKASAGSLTSRLEAAELMRADAESAAEQLKQRLEKLLGSSQEVHRQRSDLSQMLEAQLQSREQQVLALERQVTELQAAADQLGGAVCNAEAAANKLEQQAFTNVLPTFSKYHQLPLCAKEDTTQLQQQLQQAAARLDKAVASK
eukprot:gene1847-2180_t